MRDKIHFPVHRALEKDGWSILEDPYKLKMITTTVKIDLEAEKIIEAQKGTERILIEV